MYVYTPYVERLALKSSTVRELEFEIINSRKQILVNTLPETNIAPENGWLEY